MTGFLTGGEIHDVRVAGELVEDIVGCEVKENRRLTVRYEKSDINFLGFIVIAFLKIIPC
jgi:hypothetical protein